MAHLALTLVTPPAIEPVSLAQAKSFCRVDFTDDDTLFPVLITAAREYAERYMRRAIFNQTWTRTLDNFPMAWDRMATQNAARLSEWPYWSSIWNQLRIDLPKAKTQSVESITYIDSNTLTEVTLDPSTYIVDTSRLPCCIVPANAGYWPVEMMYNPGSVTITFVAGSYGDGVTVNTCPQAVVVAILMLVNYWYNNRDASGVVPDAVKSLLNPHRLTVFEYK